MFSSNIRRNLKKFINNTFSKEQINYLCLSVEKNFDAHRIMKYPKGMTYQRGELVEAIVEYFNDKTMLYEFIIAALNFTRFKGRNIRQIGIDKILRSLEDEGLFYNADANRIEKIDKSGLDFGLLFHGRSYYLTFMSIDISGSSYFVENYPSGQVLQAFDGFKNFIKKKVEKYNGRIWEWEGDGGIAAFYGNITSSTLCGIEVIMHNVLFNNTINKLDKYIDIRLGSHAGWITFKNNYKEMALGIKDESETIQKKASKTNCFVISDEVFKHLDSKLRNNFISIKKMGKTLYEFDKDFLIHSKELL